MKHEIEEMLNRLVTFKDAGRTARWHTMPHATPESVGEHSWNLATSMRLVWPDAPDWIIIEALYHDVGEAQVGDLPWPVKANNPTLMREFETLELEARKRLGAPPPPSPEKYDLEWDRWMGRMKSLDFVLALMHMMIDGNPQEVRQSYGGWSESRGLDVASREIADAIYNRAIDMTLPAARRRFTDVK